MRWWTSVVLAAWMAAAPGVARAADYVGIFGSYYLERSTRVISPMVRISKDLPAESQLELTYLVDQITSASAAFINRDDIFQEHRHEVRLGGAMRFLDRVTPSLEVRYSDEPDYRSVGGGAGVAIDLFERTSTLDLSLGLLRDWLVDDPDRATSAAGPDTQLWTVRAAAGWTQTLSKQMLGGLAIELQVLRGYQRNQYRVEQHPRERDRFALSGWLAYRFSGSKTTIRVDERLYADTWEVLATTTELRVTQGIVRSLEAEPFIRVHFQKGVFFEDPVVLPDGASYHTADPKLTTFNAQTLGLQVSWKLSFLHGTFLQVFEDARIQPSYGYLRQTNRYGNAHIAQLGMFWPF